MLMQKKMEKPKNVLFFAEDSTKAFEFPEFFITLNFQNNNKIARGKRWGQAGKVPLYSF